MAIILRACIVTETKTGERRIHKRKIIKKWSNAEIDTLEFDIFSNEAWRRFLTTYRTDRGGLLPRTTNAGDPIAYEVFAYGMAGWMREVLGLSGRISYVRMFPIDERTREKLLVVYHGELK